MKAPLIYLDHHATTPCATSVVGAMQPFFTEAYGNAASRFHAQGKRARDAVETARQEVAAFIGANPREIIFTSGATESLNIALQGLASAAAKPGHFIGTTIEHPAVLDTLRALETKGHRVTLLPVDSNGLVNPDSVGQAIAEDTLGVCVIGASNEIGTIQPLGAIAAHCRQANVPLISDTTQWVGNIPFNVDDLGCDFATISAHKMYGPKGIGCLYVRQRRPAIAMDGLIHGGGHERGLRSGTLNVPAIVGLGEAVRIAASDMEEAAQRIGGLRDMLRDGLLARIAGVHVNGTMAPRLPNNLNVSIEGVEGRRLMQHLPTLALSTGSACSSAETEPSHVIRALGFGDARAVTALRFGLGRQTTLEEIQETVARVAVACAEVRGSQ